MNSHPLGRVEARKFAHCFCVGINFSFARAIGATQEAHFISYCRLLPPRQSAKLLEGNRVTGAGDGNRTRTPFEFATIYVGQSVICMLPPCSKQMTWRFRGPIAAFSRLENPGRCSDDNKIDCVGRGIQTHEPLYFNGLPGTAPNYKFNADKTTNRIATGNNRNNQGKSCPEVDQTSQYKRVCRY